MSTLMPVTGSTPRRATVTTLTAALLLQMFSPGLTPAAYETEEPPPIGEQVASVAAPEGSTYARVRHLEGRVTLLASAADTDEEVTINTPIAPGDMIETGTGGRVEVQLADGSLARLDSSTRATFLSLADAGGKFEDRTVVSLDRGSLSLQVVNLDTERRQVRVDTDAATVYAVSNGLFRIDIGPAGRTRVVSRRGVAEVIAKDESVLVRTGEQTFAEPGDEPEQPLAASTRSGDEFDRYIETRRLAYVDRDRADQPEGDYAADLPEEVQPYSDELQYYGTWYDHPTYGAVWAPSVDDGWSPYVHGYWGWRPIGWTWISYDPWGYAPYHYGRWENWGSVGWCWIPGAVYAPAWVWWGYYPGYIGWCPTGWWGYPCGWGFSVSFGAFYAPNWCFANWNNFCNRQVWAANQIPPGANGNTVAFANSGPRVQPSDFRRGTATARFESSRQDARRQDAQMRQQVGNGRDSRLASFRDSEPGGRAAQPRRSMAGGNPRSVGSDIATRDDRRATPSTGGRAAGQPAGRTVPRATPTERDAARTMPDRGSGRATPNRDTGRVVRDPAVNNGRDPGPRRLLSETETRREPAAAPRRPSETPSRTRDTSNEDRTPTQDRTPGPRRAPTQDGTPARRPERAAPAGETERRNSEEPGRPPAAGGSARSSSGSAGRSSADGSARPPSGGGGSGAGGTGRSVPRSYASRSSGGSSRSSSGGSAQPSSGGQSRSSGGSSAGRSSGGGGRSSGGSTAGRSSGGGGGRSSGGSSAGRSSGGGGGRSSGGGGGRSSGGGGRSSGGGSHGSRGR